MALADWLRSLGWSRGQVMPCWTEKLSRPVRDRVDGVELRTRDDARRYITALPEQRAKRRQWEAAAQLLLDGADAETVTRKIEIALRYEARLGYIGSRRLRFHEAVVKTYVEIKGEFRKFRDGSATYLFAPIIAGAALLSGASYAYAMFGKINVLIAFLAGALAVPLIILIFGVGILSGVPVVNIAGLWLESIIKNREILYPILMFLWFLIGTALVLGGLWLVSKTPYLGHAVHWALPRE